MVNINPAEYVTQFDSSDIPTPSTAWALTSPDATVWGPSVSTSGIVSMASGGTVGDSVVFVGLDGTAWVPSISNGGIITATQSGILSSAVIAASLTDSAGVTWTFYVDDTQQVRVTTATILPALFRYPAFVLSYTPTSNTDVCLIHSIRLNLNARRRAA